MSIPDWNSTYPELVQVINNQAQVIAQLDAQVALLTYAMIGIGVTALIYGVVKITLWYTHRKTLNAEKLLKEAR